MTEKFNRFDGAVRGQKVDRTPIWFMRQAGRYLPEYREVRKRLSFDEMLADAGVAAEITLQPIRRFDLDAASATLLAQRYGRSDAAFLGFLGSLGLRDGSQAKPGLGTLIGEARARGF